MRILAIVLRFLRAPSTVGALVLVMLLVAACSGSSGNTIQGAPDGDNVYRDLLYKSCDSEQERLLDDGTTMTVGQCRCVVDLAAADAGSYRAFTEGANAGTIDSTTFALTNFSGVLSCLSH